MFKNTIRWCEQVILNNFLFERMLNPDEWEAINSGNHAQMCEIVQDAVLSSHTSIMSYIIRQEGMKQYCRTHILGTESSKEYAKAILTNDVRGTHHEYIMYQIGDLSGKKLVVENALEQAEFGVVMIMFKIAVLLPSLLQDEFTKNLL